MRAINKGYISFSDKYNKKTDTVMPASMSFSNGKDENGNWNGCTLVIPGLPNQKGREQWDTRN